MSDRLLSSMWALNESVCVWLQADATGALEAVKAAVGVLPQDRVAPRFLLTAAADITTSDVDLAFASGALILGFNVEPSEAVQAAAKQYGAHASLLIWLEGQLRKRLGPLGQSMACPDFHRPVSLLVQYGNDLETMFLGIAAPISEGQYARWPLQLRVCPDNARSV